MPTPLSLAQLLVRESKEAIYQTALNIGTLVGLNTSSWRAGDPTRSQFLLESEILSALEGVIVGYVGSDFLDFATGVWLKITAKQKYNVDVPDATFATTKVVLTNTAGGVYDIDANDITFRDPDTKKTFHNTSGGHLGSSTSSENELTVDVEADEAGSASSSAAGGITEMVTVLLGVTCTNPTAAIGIDEQDEDVTKQQCRDSLGPLSPNGPRDAYRFVARTSALTGTGAVTKVRVYGRSTTGRVRVYVGGPSGPVAEADRALVEAAVVRHAMGVTQTPAVLVTTAVVVAVTYEKWIYKSINKTEEQVLADDETELEKLFARKEIGGDRVSLADTLGRFATSEIKTVLDREDQVFKVTVSAPAIDIGLADGEQAVLGLVTGVIHFVDDP